MIIDQKVLSMTTKFYSYCDSPVGRLLMAGDGNALHILSFPTGHKTITPQPGWARSETPFTKVIRQLEAYFSGELRNFNLPYQLSGTIFQKRVWRALANIPYGETRSYGDLARQLGTPNASRAVGAANGDNPLPIILPCHRVIGANGSLIGLGGGLPAKKFLLNHEAEVSGAPNHQALLL